MEQNIFWIKTGETFAGNGVGSDITKYLEGDLDNDGNIVKGSRLEGLKLDGKVSFDEPLTTEVAEEQELNQLRATIKDQTEKISELKASAKSKAKIPASVAKKIKKLESENELNVDIIK
ncbi:MAG: hypothetical protein GY841_13640, partial [FCB group bacterium]|nr:hypothetical protein [FCB group bacterium]